MLFRSATTGAATGTPTKVGALIIGPATRPTGTTGSRTRRHLPRAGLAGHHGRRRATPLTGVLPTRTRCALLRLASATAASIIGALISAIISAAALTGSTVPASVTPTRTGGLPIPTSGEWIIGNPRGTRTWFRARLGLWSRHGSRCRHARFGGRFRGIGFCWFRKGRGRGLGWRGGAAWFWCTWFRGNSSKDRKSVV